MDATEGAKPKEEVGTFGGASSQAAGVSSNAISNAISNATKATIGSIASPKSQFTRNKSTTPLAGLDSLAHIANMSHELQSLNKQLKDNEAENENGSSHGSRGKPKRMACVECRQQKSRCDAHEKHPQPCTRCQKKGLNCDLKSDYKRTYKRARIAQIEREFSELKKTLTAAQAAELLSKVPSLGSPGLTSVDGTPNSGTDATTPARDSNDTRYDYQGTNQSNLLNNSQTQNNLNSTNSQYHQTNNQDISHSNFPNNSKMNSQAAAQFVQPNQQAGTTTFNNNNNNTPNLLSQTFSHIPIVPAQENSPNRYSSESIPNTPSIFRPIDHPTGDETKVVVPEYALVCEEKSLSVISLSPETIRALFIEYVEYYHPILPVVDVAKGPERIYKLCPALFWVIMFVSLRRFHEDKSLLIQMSPLVKGVLAEIMISPISRYNPTEEDEPILNVLSVYAVQAFLIYSYWPPITSSLSADSSYSTVGVAVLQAIRIGLHSPPSQGHKTPQQVAMAQENSKTWIMCNIASQTISTSFGLPAFVQFDTSVWTSIARPSEQGMELSKPVQFMMEIAHFEDQAAKTLNTNPMDPYGLVDPTERLPLLKVLLSRLDGLEVRMSNELPSGDGFRRFQLYCSRVHLLTYYFMDSSRMAQFELQRGLIKVYNAAITLINLTSAFQARDKKFVRYLPSVYILNIWQAACIIGKLYHSPMKRVIDLGSGKQSYSAAITLAARASILKHDIAHRSSGIMRNMWQLFRTLDHKKLTSLSISVRTRMSASVFFDCMHLLRDQVGMLKLNSRTDVKADLETNLEDEYEEDDDDEVAVSEEEHPTSKSTPGSTGSKRPRSLSNTVDAESKARKIMRTIPLDPQPIAVGAKRSSIFNVVNNSSDSPNVTTPGATPQVSPQVVLPPHFGTHQQGPLHSQPIYQQASPVQPPQTNSQIQNQQPQQSQQPQQFIPNILQNQQPVIPQASYIQSPLQHVRKHEESPVGSENLEVSDFDMNSDLLWKDLDSVMNDFGFHTSY